ncbi:TonB-dependent receptor [Parabacteroides faecis]|uniref:SusC/RagA family TonB-linked outer membrane protein n=1 Tax=Parabacteroides TaxID=375288 RepID=UPI000EFE4E57|nr:TonB-dependent receptor [Parabacteroides faecis]RHR93836.1 SusC/RagA family TonB-linked outer membrane protein [Parabacteroides sp. AF14-59]
MKITFLCMFIFVLQLFAFNGEAQNKVVKLQSENLSIEELFKEIEQQTDYLILYSTSEIKSNFDISLNRKKAKVYELLDDALKGKNMKYELSDNYIILSPLTKSERDQQAGRIISGVVKDQEGEPVIGANVMEKGTTNGVVTDLEGKFTLKVPSNAVLTISFIGYITQEIRVDNQSQIKIILKEHTESLNEVVVVGYGVQRKGDVASAISSIKSKDFTHVPSPDAAQLIRGRVAGLAVVQPDANPLSTSQLSLRGITTLTSSSSPLILIDGIPGNLTSVSPDDIEQIDVLKDGSAAAIYGTRGTNGVILITTKNANGEMPTTIDVNAYLSTQKISRKLDMLTAEQYREKAKEGVPGATDYGANTDWLDEITHTPLSQVYNISLRGGSKTTNYVASFDYRKLEGIIKRFDNHIIYPRIEITHRMFNNKLKLNASVSGYKQKHFDGSDGGGYRGGIYESALKYNPTEPVKDENGVWTEKANMEYFNPANLLWEMEGENTNTNLKMFANVIFSPIAGLDIKLLGSNSTTNQTRGYYETAQNTFSIRNGRTGYASRGASKVEERLYELTAQYQKRFKDKHNITLLGGYSWIEYNDQNYWMQNFDFPSDDYSYNSIGDGQGLRDGRANISSYQGQNKLISYFGRVNYSFDGRYLASVSVRHEGSSKFGANHKWGTFPAFSLAWNIKEEAFMQDIQPLSTLKIRGGFGITGTEPGRSYMSLNTLNFGTYAYCDGKWIQSIRPSSNPNPDLRWEKKEEINIGLDFGFFDEQITGSIDFYNRDTKDLLWNYDVPSPPYLYANMDGNGGSIRNRGFELSIQATPVRTKDFQWTTNANYSTNKNKLLSLSNDMFISTSYADAGQAGNPIMHSTHRLEEGKPIGNFYGYKTIDIDDDGHWVIEGEDGNPKPIALAVASDKQVIGNGLPKHYVNWNNAFTYKNWDLAITMRGAFGFQIINSPEMFFGLPVVLQSGWNVMEKAFDNVYGKRPLATDQSLDYVSYYIENGNYWKIDNLTFGYTFYPKTEWMENLRIYGSISNLAVITGYNGIDPEVNISGLAPGQDDRARYPAARTFTLGVSLKF